MNSMSDTISQFAESFDLSCVPPAAVHRAKIAILDAIGCGFGSIRTDFGQSGWAALSGSSEGSSATVFGREQRLSVNDAMFVNALLIHGNDFDDTHIGAGVHVSSSALPCVLGVSESRDLDTRDMLAAYILSIEIMARVGAVAERGLLIRGFHPTGVVGVFGCAVAAGRLLKLRAPDLTNAQGIALSFASGTVEFFSDGSWTKRLHPGNAAANGYNAARFAGNAFQGPKACYEGKHGLYNQYLPEGYAWQTQNALSTLGKEWAVQELSLKPYPSGHFTHACADAVLALTGQHHIRPDQVRRLVARIPRSGRTLAEKRDPANAYEAKFSLSHCVAVTMVLGRLGLQEFEDTALLSRPDIKALSEKIVCEIDEHVDDSRNLPGSVTVELVDGRSFTYDEKLNRGGPDRPMDLDDVIVKFRGNVQGVLTDTQAERIISAVGKLDCDGTARNFTALLRQASVSFG